VINQGFVAFEE